MSGARSGARSGAADGAIRLPVSQRIAAGKPGAALAAGSAARIFTGALIPDGADAVVMQEACTADGDHVVLTDAPAAGDFAGDIEWNFTKFLIDRNGNVIARFPSNVKPDDVRVTKLIEQALAAGEKK